MKHCFTYSLVGHAGGLDKAVTIEKAEILNQKLKRERQIELMGENHRYYDLRRWKIDAPLDGSLCRP